MEPEAGIWLARASAPSCRRLAAISLMAAASDGADSGSHSTAPAPTSSWQRSPAGMIAGRPQAPAMAMFHDAAGSPSQAITRADARPHNEGDSATSPGNSTESANPSFLIWRRRGTAAPGSPCPATISLGRAPTGCEAMASATVTRPLAGVSRPAHIRVRGAASAPSPASGTE